MADEDTKGPTGQRLGLEDAQPLVAYLVPVPGGDSSETLMLWPVIKDHKGLVLACLIVCMLVAVILAFVMTPIYRAEVLLSPVAEGRSQGKLMGFASQLEGMGLIPRLGEQGNNIKDEAIATIKSRGFTLQFINEEKLLPVLFAKYWDSAKGGWIARPGKSPPTDWDAFELFDTKVRRVVENRGNPLVTLSVEWKDPELAAQWANSLVDRINSHMRNRAIEEAEKSVAYLNQELGKTTVVELQKAIYALIEEQVGQIMMANVREEYAFKVIDPAVPPDADEFNWPKRGLMIGVGAMLGLLLGLLSAVVRSKDSDATA